MAFSGSKKPKRTPRGGIIAALDVGSTKVCCFIARVEDQGALRVIGIGHHSSLGVRAGSIVDMDGCEASIGHAVHAAEQMAGETVREVVVNISSGPPQSLTTGVEVAVLGQTVSDSDLRRALAQSRMLQVPGDNDLVHAIPIGYTLDGSRGIKDPRGMFGERLGIQMHVVSAGAGPLRNLTTCVNACHLDIESRVVSSYASGLACLVEDELGLGVTCIDMGGGTTTISVFQEGHLIYTDFLPVGGQHVTSDIARGLTTPVAHAERMKTLYGSAVASSADERDLIDVPQVGEDEPTQTNHVPKSLLVGIIQPRLEEIFELARGKLERSGFAKVAGRRVVLTGGSCQLPGTRDLAQHVLDKQVRLGRPTRLGGLADSVSGPAFSTVAGLLQFAMLPQPELPLSGPEMSVPMGFFGRVGLWLRENL